MGVQGPAVLSNRNGAYDAGSGQAAAPGLGTPALKASRQHSKVPRHAPCTSLMPHRASQDQKASPVALLRLPIRGLPLVGRRRPAALLAFSLASHASHAKQAQRHYSRRSSHHAQLPGQRHKPAVPEVPACSHCCCRELLHEWLEAGTEHHRDRAACSVGHAAAGGKAAAVQAAREGDGGGQCLGGADQGA